MNHDLSQLIAYKPKDGFLNEKIILVSGAGDGIGKAAALAYAKYGATVILLGRTEEKLKEIVIKQLSKDGKPVTLETSFINDLGADSLDIVELVMELEDTFDVSIPDEDAEKIQTVGDAVRFINEHKQKKSAQDT